MVGSLSRTVRAVEGRMSLCVVMCYRYEQQTRGEVPLLYFECKMSPTGSCVGLLVLKSAMLFWEVLKHSEDGTELGKAARARSLLGTAWLHFCSILSAP